MQGIVPDTTTMRLKRNRLERWEDVYSYHSRQSG